MENPAKKEYCVLANAYEQVFYNISPAISLTENIIKELHVPYRTGVSLSRKVLPL